MRFVVKWAARLAAVVVVAGLLFVAWDQATYNFGEVQPHRLYRSGQMTASALTRTIRERNIRTVLNLRGSNPGESWYVAERAATLAAEAAQVDIAMSSCLWMSRAQLRALVDVLRTADYPMLVHCAWGSERTGLVSAFAELLRPGGSLEDARTQFSLRYLFVRINDGKIMAEHLDQYECWLKSRGLLHSPTNFLQWVADGFVPMTPSREQWPYDPYPLVVATRPGCPPLPAPTAGQGAPTRR
jgi:protein-tyrosine phosphatase